MVEAGLVSAVGAVAHPTAVAARMKSATACSPAREERGRWGGVGAAVMRGSLERCVGFGEAGSRHDRSVRRRGPGARPRRPRRFPRCCRTSCGVDGFLVDGVRAVLRHPQVSEGGGSDLPEPGPFRRGELSDGGSHPKRADEQQRAGKRRAKRESAKHRRG